MWWEGVKPRELSGQPALVAALFGQSYSIYRPVVQSMCALSACLHGIYLVSTWLLIIHSFFCLMVQLLLPYINGLVHSTISIVFTLTDLHLLLLQWFITHHRGGFYSHLKIMVRCIYGVNIYLLNYIGNYPLVILKPCGTTDEQLKANLGKA